jgi:type IV pilus assembly protein PilB
MADINIAERRIPQDGRIGHDAGGKKIDLRVATLPTVWGEKVVMRILDNSTAAEPDRPRLPARKLRARLESSYTKPYGMILVTGPTGSGKSTTLYATLNILNKPEVNIITVEDPVEYRLPGINQVQVNPKAGLTFASALRSILRSDPDIVLVGEIRDHETAQIAVEAASPVTSCSRRCTPTTRRRARSLVTEMGIEPFLVGQRARLRARPAARAPAVRQVQGGVHPDAELLEARLAPWSRRRAAGRRCSARRLLACSKTGYKGRLALHEVMPSPRRSSG